MEFEYLPFGLRTGLLILLLPGVSPASVAGNFRGLTPGLLLGVYDPEASSLKMPATDAGETSGSRSISRPRSLSPKGKQSNTSADRESINQNMVFTFLMLNFKSYKGKL